MGRHFATSLFENRHLRSVCFVLLTYYSRLVLTALGEWLTFLDHFEFFGPPLLTMFMAKVC